MKDQSEEGYIYCPNCGDDKRLSVHVVARARVEQREGVFDGFTEAGDASLSSDDDSPTECEECGFSGRWSEFEHDAEAGDDGDPAVHRALKVATGGLWILPDSMLRELVEPLQRGLNVALWRADPVGSQLKDKLRAVANELRAREVAA